MTSATYIVGDTRAVTASLPDNSVDLIFTSPPFLALRSYLPADHPAKAQEIGSESTPAEFLGVLLELVREWDRVLTPTGSLVVELGDSFSGGSSNGTDGAGVRAIEGGGNFRRDHMSDLVKSGPGWPLAKSLCGIPTLFTWSLAYGRNLLAPDDVIDPWRIRNVVVWHRPNPPVGALGDKYRPSTSYITVATKSAKRWFDLDAVRTEPTAPPQRFFSHGYDRGGNGATNDRPPVLEPGNRAHPAGAPPLDAWFDAHDGDDVWTITTDPYRGSHYACVDEQTEALTPFGWRRHTELRDGDLIAMVDHDSEVWEFAPATFHRYDFDGDLIAIDKRVTTQRLTPNHRVVYRTVKDRTPRIRRADELVTSDFLPLAAEMLPSGGVGPGQKAAALAGWFCTEGSMDKRHPWPVIHQSATANPEKVNSIRALLDAVGATYTEGERRRSYQGRPYTEAWFRVTGQFAEWLRQFHKNIPMSAVFGWSDADARALFDAMIDGDGHRRPDGRISFVQKDKAVAEAVQMLAVRLGYRSTMSLRKGGTWAVYISPGRWVDLRAGENGTASAISTEHYTGTVWCPSVPTGVWLARRYGQPFVTGNTFPRALAARVIDSMCPRHVCRTCGEPRRREVEIEYVPRGDPAKANRQPRVLAAAEGVNPSAQAMRHGEAERIVTGSSWSSCGHDDYRPGIVYDPFAGSGTTLAKAIDLGRDAIGADLDERNAELARERCGMFLTVDHIEAVAS